METPKLEGTENENLDTIPARPTNPVHFQLSIELFLTAVEPVHSYVYSISDTFGTPKVTDVESGLNCTL